ncbi:hypothetical protein E2C01_102484 [Portunus trituberculatus]|uniref:Uncharacterized protein n=1 Tax=Portunus trituberculatus TaxID=210409 RepID=A0A5B7KHF5_PORTR|nr:hypothetical protein [Portunus trituberculatus]
MRERRRQITSHRLADWGDGKGPNCPRKKHLREKSQRTRLSSWKNCGGAKSSEQTSKQSESGCGPLIYNPLSPPCPDWPITDGLSNCIWLHISGMSQCHSLH